MWEKDRENHIENDTAQWDRSQQKSLIRCFHRFLLNVWSSMPVGNINTEPSSSTIDWWCNYRRRTHLFEWRRRSDWLLIVSIDRRTITCFNYATIDIDLKLFGQIDHEKTSQIVSGRKYRFSVRFSDRINENRLDLLLSPSARQDRFPAHECCIAQ